MVAHARRPRGARADAGRSRRDQVSVCSLKTRPCPDTRVRKRGGSDRACLHRSEKGRAHARRGDLQAPDPCRHSRPNRAQGPVAARSWVQGPSIAASFGRTEGAQHRAIQMRPRRCLRHIAWRNHLHRSGAESPRLDRQRWLPEPPAKRGFRRSGAAVLRARHPREQQEWDRARR